MAFISKSELARIHKLCFQFGRYLKEVETIGCFFCINFIEYSDISEFIEEGEELTAICPNCWIDALVPLDEFDSEDHRALLNQLRLKYFGESIHFRRTGRVKNECKKNYLYQRKDSNLRNVMQEVDAKLAATDRLIGRKSYTKYEDTTLYLIPFQKEEIHLYVLNEVFVNEILQNVYQDIDFPLEQKELLNHIVKNPSLASFLIVMPESLNEDEAEYGIQLLGQVFGGYFSKLSNIPADGELNQEENIFIDQYQGSKDIINNLEKLVKGYNQERKWE